MNTRFTANYKLTKLTFDEEGTQSLKRFFEILKNNVICEGHEDSNETVDTFLKAWNGKGLNEVDVRNIKNIFEAFKDL